jgi:hypothetical protein
MYSLIPGSPGVASVESITRRVRQPAVLPVMNPPT